MSSSWFPIRHFVIGCLVGALAAHLNDTSISLPSVQSLIRLFTTRATLNYIHRCNLNETITQRTVTLNGNSGEGSGLLLDGRYVLTAAHVVEQERRMYVSGSLNENIQAWAIQLVGINRKQDLALLLVDQDFNLPPLAVSPTTLIDTPTFAYSHMQHTYLQATLGQLEDGKKFVQEFPEKVIPGDSGTILLNCAGQISGNIVSFFFNCLDENGIPIKGMDYNEKYCTYMNGGNVSATTINTFLKRYWPNYTATPFQSENVSRTGRNAASG